MKKITLCISFFLGHYFTIGQSVEITPNTLNSRQSSSIDNIKLIGNNPVNILGIRHGGSLASPAATPNNSNLLALEGAGHTGIGFTMDTGGVRIGSSETWSATANGTEIVFKTTENGTTTTLDKMKIANNGNVGIGLTSPASKLHVFNGASGVTPTSATTAVFEDNGNHYLGLNSPEANETGVLFGKPSSAASGGVIYTLTNDLHLRSGGNNTRVIVASNGNVGIGSSVPTAKLDIDGDIVIKKTTITTAGIENALNRGGGSSIYFNVSGTATLNGIAGGQDGMLLYLFTGAGSTLVINNENPNAIAANRIATNTGLAVTINGRGGATMIYDASTSFWRIIGIAN
jgi:hypothetical protein